MNLRPVDRRRTRRTIAPLTIAAALGLSLAACGDDADPTATSPTTAAPTTAAPTTSTTTSTTSTATKTTSESGTIVDVAAGAGSFSVLVEAVRAAGLVETLSGPGPFTVLAPTDAAFKDALEQLGTTKEQLLADKAKLATILKYHVIPGEAKAADVVKLDGEEIKSVAGPALMVTVSGSTVRVNDATVTQTDVEASNGVIHVIDKVLLPPS